MHGTRKTSSFRDFSSRCSKEAPLTEVEPLIPAIHIPSLETLSSTDVKLALVPFQSFLRRACG